MDRPWLCAHISDAHVLAAGEVFAGRVDTAGYLAAAVDHINAAVPQPDLVVFSGDLVNDGRPAEYAQLAALLNPLQAPLRLLPGNHDDRPNLRAALADRQAELHGPTDTIDWVVDGPVRVIGLDTHVPGRPHGALGQNQLVWLEETLAAQPAAPTLVTMHHPPFATGIGHMDAIALASADAEGLAAIIRRHPQVERVACGHLHRAISRRWAGTIAATVPSVAHAVRLDLEPASGAAWVLEPPALTWYAWSAGLGLVAHQQSIGPYDGGRFG